MADGKASLGDLGAANGSALLLAGLQPDFWPLLFSL
jgi:hypothetical protein